MRQTLETKVDNLAKKIDQLVELINGTQKKDHLITVKEAAKLFGCCEQSVREEIVSGNLTATKKGRRYMISYNLVMNRIGEL